MAKRPVKTSRYDSADYLSTPDAIDAYMDEAFKTDDSTFIAHALGVVARAKGMSKLAKKTGLSRESLYKALSMDGNPEFSTILRVMQALELKLSVTANRL